MSNLLVIPFATYLIAGFIPGYLTWGCAFHEKSMLIRAAMGSVFGLVLFGLGSILAGYTESEFGRIAPALIAYTVWASQLKRKIPLSVARELSFSGIQNIFLYLGTIVAIMIGVKKTSATLESQPLIWDGWWNFYQDLFFHISMVSESGARLPQSFPFSPDIPLAYTWFGHGVLGNISSISNSSAATMVLQFWPALFAFILPVVIAGTTLAISKSPVAAGISPLIYLTLTGPEIINWTFLTFNAIFPISLTFEFGVLFLCLLLVSLSRTSVSERTIYLFGQLVIVFLVTFAFAGSKGNASPIILSFLGFFFIKKLLLGKRWNLLTAHAIPLIGGLIAAIFLLVRSGGALSVKPASIFIGYYENPIILQTRGTLVLTLWLVSSIVIILLTTRFREALEVVGLISLGVLAGIIPFLIFDHPGKSQAYFYWGIFPLIVIVVAWATANVRILIRFEKRPWPIVIVSVAMLIILSSFYRQDFKFDQDVWSSADSGTNLNFETVMALNYIRDNSDPNDLLMTNKHCFGAGAGCGDDRYYVATAFSERRALIESFIQTDADIREKSVLLYTDKRRVNDLFYASPTTALADQLKGWGVKWIYVNKSVGTVADFSPFAELRMDNANAAVWYFN
jgi:hypothetical protein